MPDDIGVPDKLAWQQNRRRLAYIAMLAILVTIAASFVWPERAAQVPAAEMIYISLAGVIMGFFGADALVSRKKGK
jgi:predicted membrane protein